MQMSHVYSALSSSVQAPRIRLPAVRHLWAAATVVSKSGSLSEHLDICFSMQPELCSSPDVCVLATARSYSSKEIESIPALISNKINPKLFLGCVADRVYTNTSSGSGAAILLGKFASENTIITPFFISEKDRTRKKVRSPSVGRWGRPEDFRPDLKDLGWDRFRSLSTAVNEVMLPEGLKKLKESIEPPLLFMMSDNEPHQLLETLDQHFPSSHKFGLIAASTPFVTGRPFTLFVNNTIVSGGIYGFAVSSHNSISTKPSSPELNHTALVPLGDPMKITNCQGNIILELNDSNAMNHLLDLLNKDSVHLLTKEKEFYLGLYPHKITNLMDPDMMICRITSGDPSKGNMAVDTTKDLKIGQFVQFMQRNENHKSQMHPSLSGLAGTRVFLSASDHDQTLDLVHNNEEKSAEICEAVFGGSSENGFIVGRGRDGVRGSDSWVCEVPFSGVNFIF